MTLSWQILYCPRKFWSMADTIELFLVGQGLLLVTFITMVGLFLLLLFVRTHFGSGIRLVGWWLSNVVTTQGRDGRRGAGSPQDQPDHLQLLWCSVLRPDRGAGEDGLGTNEDIRLITGEHWTLSPGLKIIYLLLNIIEIWRINNNI